jgi:hypothetical protein
MTTRRSVRFVEFAKHTEREREWKEKVERAESEPETLMCEHLRKPPGSPSKSGKSGLGGLSVEGAKQAGWVRTTAYATMRVKRTLEDKPELRVLIHVFGIGVGLTACWMFSQQ